MIKCFNIHDIKYDNYIVIIGMRASGKSLLIKKIMTLFDTPSKIAVSKSESIYTFYKYFINKRFIYNQYTPELMNNIYKRQKLIINNAPKKDQTLILALDDCMSARCNWVNNDEIKKLYNNKNDYNIMLISSFNYAFNIPSNYREKYDYVFLAEEQFISTRKRLYEHYGKYIFDTFEEFNDVFITIIKMNSYNFFVLDIKNKKYYYYLNNSI